MLKLTLKGLNKLHIQQKIIILEKHAIKDFQFLVNLHTFIPHVLVITNRASKFFTIFILLSIIKKDGLKTRRCIFN